MQSQIKTFGSQNPDRTFFVLRSFGVESGLLALYQQKMLGVEYAIENGYVPIVDLKNYRCQYSTDDNVNAWDQFFEQPTEIALDEVYKSKNVMIQGTEIPKTEDSIFSKWENDLFNRKRHEFIHKYAKVSSGIENEAVQYCQKHKHLLGVFLRGTDYVALRPKGHKVQPTCEEMFVKIDEFLKQHSIEHIFLVTEDKSIRDKFEAKYGSLLLENIGLVFDQYDQSNYLYKSIPENLKNENAKLYLKKLVILSRCDYLVSSIANGSAFAISYSKGYKDHYVFDKGEY